MTSNPNPAPPSPSDASTTPNAPSHQSHTPTPVHTLTSSPTLTADRATTSLPTPIILGPTGSGKTGIALDLVAALKNAHHLQSEIISADSRAIYRGLDIGTAKPTREEQNLVPHHGLDLVDINERFTVADWKTYAEQKISGIKSKNHLPLIVGGTGLYIDALIFDYQFRGPTGHRIGDFEQKSCSDRTEVKGDFLLIGLKLPREELRARLKKRIDQMFAPELFEESKKVVQFANLPKSQPSPPSSSPALKPLFAKAGNIYRFAYAYQNGELPLEDAKEQAFYADYHLAKRQLTWFKRNSNIIWLPPEKVVQFVLKNFPICDNIDIE